MNTEVSWYFCRRCGDFYIPNTTTPVNNVSK